MMFYLKRLGRKGWILPSSNFLFWSGPQQIGWYPPILGSVNCFTSSTSSNANFKRNALTKTPRNNILPHIWAPPDLITITIGKQLKSTDVGDLSTVSQLVEGKVMTQVHPLIDIFSIPHGEVNILEIEQIMQTTDSRPACGLPARDHVLSDTTL